MYDKLIVELAKARRRGSAAGEVLTDLLFAFENSPEYIIAKAEVEAADKALKEADATFREGALIAYKMDGEKKTSAYEIKTVSSVMVPDEGAALRWSLTNFTPALQLNRKIFDGAVKAGAIPAELAGVVEEAKVYIKSDLSGWLDG